MLSDAKFTQILPSLNPKNPNADSCEILNRHRMKIIEIKGSQKKQPCRLSQQDCLI